MAESAAIPQRQRGLSVKIGLWVLLSVWPMIFYAQPLWQNALADTPIAYLILIPILAMGWAWWNLGTITRPYPDDTEANLLLGGLAALVIGFILAVGPVRWPSTFVYQHVGLLLWPFWSLALAWILFGLGVTRYILAPLAYLFLAWPAIFGTLADRTQNLLTRWAITALTGLSHNVPWLLSGQVGTFYVRHGSQWIGVVVAQACSGADSLLGAAILIPLMLTVLKGPWRRMAMLVLTALVGALVINWLRLFIIVAAVHWIGGGWTFSYLHPVLGFILFAGLALGLTGLAGKLHLTIPHAWNGLALPRVQRTQQILSVVFAALLFVALLPYLSLPPGYFGNPAPVPTDQLSRLMPPLSGFIRIPKYYANESSVLGPHSATAADLYVSTRGAQILTEVWSTPSASNLASYGFRNCLLYHGENILAQWSFGLAPGIAATAYAVSLPPAIYGAPAGPTYIDIEWTDAIRGAYGVRYQRWSVALFPAAATLWPASVRHRSFRPVSLGLDAMLAPSSSGVWSRALLLNRNLLARFATLVYARQHAVSRV